jgi:hypothetical protein
MTTPATLEEALQTVSQLPPEQQAMLVDIIQNRLIENRRKEIAIDAKASIEAFRQGALKPKSAESIIAELDGFLMHPTVAPMPGTYVTLLA